MVVGSVLYSVLIAVYGLVNYNYIMEEVKKFNVKLTAATVGFVVLSMFLSIIIYYRLLEKYDVHKVAAITYLSPLFTMVIAAVFLKESVTIYSALGVILIVAGVLCISKS